MTEPAPEPPRRGPRDRSPVAPALVLLGAALAIRLGVVALASAVGPADSVGDVAYHSQLVADPIGHLRDGAPAVAQYAPYLGILEWVTAKPWLALGASDTTALRLGSVIWDLAGMALLLAATARRFPDRLVLVGALWAAAPVFWTASAFSAQDETIAAAVVSGVVVLVLARRRNAAVALCVLGLFLAKILLLPVVVALLLTTPRAARLRAWVTAALTLAAGVAATWALSGTDGLSQQGGYTTDVVGFSVSLWSTLVLHHVVEPATAIRLSVIIAAVASAGVIALCATASPRLSLRDRSEGATASPRLSRRDRSGGWRHRTVDELEPFRLAAALLLVAFSLLAISNPEYLCLAAPAAIVACIDLDARRGWIPLVATATLAWAVNATYYLLRRAYEPTGSLLGTTGFARSVEGRARLLDLSHQALLVAFLAASMFTAWTLLRGPRTGSSDANANAS